MSGFLRRPLSWRRAWLSSHSGDIAKRLATMSSLFALICIFRPPAKEYPLARGLQKMVA
jgi:hypothetical protein